MHSGSNSFLEQKTSFLGFHTFVDLLLTIPAHSSECEIGFSLMKLMKTDWRNSLTDEAVTDLIRIALHFADIKEFNPDKAVHQWKKASIRGRLPNQRVWKKKKVRGASRSRILTLPHMNQMLMMFLIVIQIVNNRMRNWGTLWQLHQYWYQMTS